MRCAVTPSRPVLPRCAARPCAMRPAAAPLAALGRPRMPALGSPAPGTRCVPPLRVPRGVAKLRAATRSSAAQAQARRRGSDARARSRRRVRTARIVRTGGPPESPASGGARYKPPLRGAPPGRPARRRCWRCRRILTRRLARRRHGHCVGKGHAHRAARRRRQRRERGRQHVVRAAAGCAIGGETPLNCSRAFGPVPPLARRFGAHAPGRRLPRLPPVGRRALTRRPAQVA